MTANAISAAKAQEEVRSNKAREKETNRSNLANERLTERGQNMKMVSDVLGNVTQAATGVVKANPKLVGGASTGVKTSRAYRNHPSWYNVNPTLVEDSSRLNYFVQDGTKIGQDNVTSYYVMPWIPTIGVNNKKGKGAATLAARSIDAYIRSKNSRSRSYDANDLLLMEICLDSAYAYIEHLKLIYKLLTQNDQYSYNFPDSVIKTMGYDVKDLRINATNLALLLNSTIKQLSNYPLIGSFSFVQRHQYLSKNIFVDSLDPNCRSAIITFPLGFFGFSEEPNSQGKPSVTAQWGEVPEINGTTTAVTGVTFNKIKMHLDGLVAELARSETTHTMISDMNNAYSPSDFVTIDEISIDKPGAVDYIYDMEIAAQLANATLIGYVNPASVSIRTDSSNSIYQGLSTGDEGVVCYPTIMSVHSDDIESKHGLVEDGVTETKFIRNTTSDRSPLWNMCITRLHARVVYNINNSTAPTMITGKVISCGSECMLAMRRVPDKSAANIAVLPIGKEGTDALYTWVSCCQLINLSLDSSGAYVQDSAFNTFLSTVYAVNTMPWFHYAPVINLCYGEGVYNASTKQWSNGSTAPAIPLVYDYYNLSPIQDDTIDNMHQVALLSEFGISDSAYSYRNPAFVK